MFSLPVLSIKRQETALTREEQGERAEALAPGTRQRVRGECSGSKGWEQEMPGLQRDVAAFRRKNST